MSEMRGNEEGPRGEMNRAPGRREHWEKTVTSRRESPGLPLQKTPSTGLRASRRFGLPENALRDTPGARGTDAQWRRRPGWQSCFCKPPLDGDNSRVRGPRQPARPPSTSRQTRHDLMTRFSAGLRGKALVTSFQGTQNSSTPGNWIKRPVGLVTSEPG